MKKLIVANWKCNPATLKQAKRLFNSVRKGVKSIKKVEMVICPPFVYLSNVQYLKSNIKYREKRGEEENEVLFALGAQDVFWEEKGAFTGEISPAMLKDLGVDYVIIGHSERRKYQKETDEIINKKLKAVLRVGLRAILCLDNISQIPSFLRKREGRRGRSPLRPKKDLSNFTKKELSNLVIAYEPVFAIGTGKPCSIEKAKKMRRAIKKEVFNRNMPILYGGSVNSQNAGNYIKEGGFQGLLIGGASLNVGEFLNIVKNIDPVRSPGQKKIS